MENLPTMYVMSLLPKYVSIFQSGKKGVKSVETPRHNRSLKDNLVDSGSNVYVTSSEIGSRVRTKVDECLETESLPKRPTLLKVPVVIV